MHFTRPKRALHIIVLIVGVLSAIHSPLRLDAKTKRLPASEQIINLIQQIQENMVASKYQHATQVWFLKGIFNFDCSGMASWILKRTAPGALQAVEKSPSDKRPLARDFFRAIDKIRPGKKKGPWMRPKSIAHAKPGDVLAWIRPKWLPSAKATGHVAFILDTPVPNPGPVPGWLYRIADASKFRHEDDTRKKGETGFGIGTLLIPIDDNGKPTGYGWFGSETEHEWVVSTRIAIGRPLF